MGKHTTDLDLRSATDRATFESLLAEADIFVDGYGFNQLSELTKKRGRGYVYVSENCFGYNKFIDRPGWQQIADCVSGVAWAQGNFMGLDEPCIPPFPMSDYGTGLMGAIATFHALNARATEGGSWHAKVCLVDYDDFLFRLQPYPEEIQTEIRKKFTGPFFDLRHADSTDVFSGRALETMKKAVPRLFEGEDEWSQTWWSEGFNAKVKAIKPVSNVEGIRMGYERATRPNGFDAATWESWEEVKPLK
jgi:hypothetical protein